MTFLQRKCGDYEIKPRIFCVEIGNLCGESAAYLKKCGPRINMRTLADYALNYAIVFLDGLLSITGLEVKLSKCWKVNP